MTHRQWLSKKPKFNKECILITATWINRHECYHYKFFQIIKLNDGEGWYMAVVCEDGGEWGDIGDLHADLYFTMPLLKKQ